MEWLQRNTATALSSKRSPRPRQKSSETVKSIAASKTRATATTTRSREEAPTCTADREVAASFVARTARSLLAASKQQPQSASGEMMRKRNKVPTLRSSPEDPPNEGTTTLRKQWGDRVETHQSRTPPYKEAKPLADLPANPTDPTAVALLPASENQAHPRPTSLRMRFKPLSDLRVGPEMIKRTRASLGAGAGSHPQGCQELQ
mmetsp:Transcript_88580/g.185114  ORF Transcript_88580/g.185114 Transcript_88580/m.185114 type:complete len:204 (+) Transcript_88580:155-766(+)